MDSKELEDVERLMRQRDHMANIRPCVDPSADYLRALADVVPGLVSQVKEQARMLESMTRERDSLRNQLDSSHVLQRAQLQAEVEGMKLQISEAKKLMEDMIAAAGVDDWQGACTEVLEDMEKFVNGLPEKRVDEICWCAAKSEATGAVCPIHG